MRLLGLFPCLAAAFFLVSCSELVFEKAESPQINTPQHEGAPFLTDDGLELYFDSTRTGGEGQGDIWKVSRDAVGSPWREPVNLGAPANTASFESAPYLSKDGSILYFISSRAGGLGSFDIWMSKRQGPAGEWSAALNPGPPLNSSGNDGGPCLSPDGLSLYWCDNYDTPPRPGGKGRADIWFATRRDLDAPWEGLSNLGDINTGYNEISPSLSKDGLYLFFVSDREGGQGDRDLWVSRRGSSAGQWLPPRNLGPAVNGPYDEGRACLSADYGELYFATARYENQGDQDILVCRIKSREAFERAFGRKD